jgi:hypothetical protein
MLEPADTTRQVANLAVVVGVGEFGAHVVAQLRTMLRSAPEGHRLAVATWLPTDGPRTLAELTTKDLLAQANLGRIEELGFEILGRALGHAPPVASLLVADAGESAAAATVEETLASLPAAQVNISRVGLLTRSGSETEMIGLAEVLASDLGRRTDWDLVLPFPVWERAAGTRSREDLVATVARALAVLTIPGSESVLRSLLQRPGASTGPDVAHIGGAFLDARSDELVDELSHLVAAELLRRQFGGVKAYQPAAAFDEQGRTSAERLVAAERLAQSVMANTPFVLDIVKGGPWHVRLSATETAVELQGMPRSRWVAVLRKLKDFFDFTKARRWRETIENEAANVAADLKQSMVDDIDQLYRYPRGPDRVLTWCERVRNRLEQAVDIAAPTVTDFKTSIDRLQQEIATFPDPVALGTRAALLGGLAALTMRTVVAWQWGMMAGIIAFAIVLAVAAGCGLWIYQAAHSRLMRARTAAVAALSSHYEAQARDNLAQALDRVRKELIVHVEAIKAENQRLAQAMVAHAQELDRPPKRDPAVAVVSVEWAVPFGSEGQFLEYLSLPFDQIVRDAAEHSALLPIRDGDAIQRGVPVESVVQFARTYLDSRRPDLTLREQIEFRCGQDAAYLDRVVAKLDRQSMVVTGAMLMRVHEAIATRDQSATQQQIELELLACLRVGAVQQSLRGAS